MRNSIVLFIIMFIGISFMANAQKLIVPNYSFDDSKPVYVTLADGTSITASLSDVNMSNGLIKNIKLTSDSGELIYYMISDIKNIYIASESNENAGKRYDFLRDPSKWDNSRINKTHIQEGYAFFEQVEIEIGRKSRVLLMQLLNPSFSSIIKVYNDPWQSETDSSSKIQTNKSFYVKDGGRPAFKLDNNSYSDHFIALFGECQQMIPLKEKAKWDHFDQHVYDYTNCK